MPTEPSSERDRVFRFGPFELSERGGELRKSGVRIKLQEQPFHVLAPVYELFGEKCMQAAPIAGLNDLRLYTTTQVLR